jgi:hypothetical protein
MRSFDFYVHMKFYKIILFSIALFACVLRIYNVDAFSLWIDEIYTMFAVHPSLSISDIINDQGAHQPPLFFIMSRFIFNLVGYEAIYLRYLSITFSFFSVIVIGLIGKEIFKNIYMGFFLTMFVATNRMLIYYSMDGRFYLIEFFFSALVILFFIRLYVKGVSTKMNNWGLGISMSLGAYFHHFGLIPPFILFLFVTYTKRKEILNNSNFNSLLKLFKPFVLMLVALTPWIFNGLITGAKINSYWLKELDVEGYILHGFNYPTIINVIFYILWGVGSFLLLRNRKIQDLSFVLFVQLGVVLIPLLFSFIKYPILVPRYSIVMFPYVMISIAFAFDELLSNVSLRYSRLFLMITVIVISLPGIHSVFKNPRWFEKSQWREAAANISNVVNRQQDTNWVVFSPTSGVRTFAAIDYYLDYKHPKSKLIDNFVVGVDDNVILIEVESYSKIASDKFTSILKQYIVSTYEIGAGLSTVKVHYCHRK